MLVEPTEEGWALRDSVASVPYDLVSSMDMTAREGEQLRKLLAKLLEHLDEASARPTV